MGLINDLQETRKELERLKADYSQANDIIVEQTKEIERLKNITKEVRKKINNFDVFKEFTFPLMKREEENQVKSSIDYEWRKSIKEPLLKILDKGVDN